MLARLQRYAETATAFDNPGRIAPRRLPVALGRLGCSGLRRKKHYACRNSCQFLHFILI